MLETLTSIARAGADIILTYHAKDFARSEGGDGDGNRTGTGTGTWTGTWKG